LIADEGKIIIKPVLLLFIITLGYYNINPLGILYWVNLVLFIFFIFILYFFREPKRLIQCYSKFLSPADGKIIQITDIEDEDLGKAKQISIFLSIFNVHSQRVPFTGKVVSKLYNSGRFHLAFNNKTSKYNEHTSVLFETDNGQKYKVKQIAGFIARRIINYMIPNERVEIGERLGFIRFGSRVEIILPKNFIIDVKIGDRVKGNISVIGRFN